MITNRGWRRYLATTPLRLLLLAALPALMLTACSTDDLATDNTGEGTSPSDDGRITFDISFARTDVAGPQSPTDADGQQNLTDIAGPQTRVATSTDGLFKSTWEEGDEIGVFAKSVDPNNPVVELEQSGNPLHNVKLTYTSGKWVGDAWWPTLADFSADDRMCFFAYYPYDAAATDPAAIAFAVKADQSNATGGKPNYNLSDLLITNADTYGNKRGETVKLTFHHALSLVQVSVPSPGKGFGPNEALEVSLMARAKATANLNDNGTKSEAKPADNDNDPVAIRMQRVEQAGTPDYTTTYTYRALVPAQEFAKGSRIFRLYHDGGQLFIDAPLADKVTLTQGKAAKFTREMPASALHTVHISAGTFLMGSSDGSNINDKDGSGLNTTPAETGRDNSYEAQHKVTLTRGFRMSRYEVTNAQYAAFLNDIKCGKDGKANVTGYDKQTLIEKDNVLGVQWNNDVWSPATGKADFPVVRVTWYGARAYADWAGASLPTEAQWEYACRAGSTTAFTGGDGEEHGLGDYGWYSRNSGNIAHPVGTKKPNAWGLYDMHGNVSEWCADWHDNDYGSTPGAPATDPAGPGTGTDRTLRNGSFGNTPKYCRSASRKRLGPGDAYSDVGFRVVFNE